MTTMTDPYPTEPRTLTFNKEDWSGETVTVEVREGNRFDYFEDTFYFEDTTPEDQEEEPGSDYYFRRLTVWDTKKSWGKFPIFKVCKFDGEDHWTVSHNGVVRDAEDPVEAAYKTLCMVL